MTMQNDVQANRTGVGTSPKFAQELSEAAKQSEPSSKGNESEIAKVRSGYQKAGPAIGSMPPAQASLSAIETILMDKLGERAAFERTGTRLYAALIEKHRTEGIRGEPALRELEHFHQEELAHFALVTHAIVELGGDPTVETPSADLSGVASKGIGLVLTDPRTTFTQCLEAILIAELADNDGWTLLGKVAAAAGKKDLVNRIDEALREEQNHLDHVRRWLESRTLAKAK